jgi:hypothetical protein
MSDETATKIIRHDEKPGWPLQLAEGAYVMVPKTEPARNHAVFERVGVV